MKTELFTVSKIFHEALFRIPDYQRGYSWEEVHLRDFWSDLEQLEDSKSHYTGVVTVEAVPEPSWAKWDDDTWIIRSRKYAPYYVVDGQQRLTTVTILIQCIIEAAQTAEATSLNYTQLEIIRRKYLFEDRADNIARAYIFGYEKDNPSYEFLKKGIFGEESATHSPDEPTIYIRNLRNAKQFFTERLSQKSFSQLETLYTRITQQLVFNVYEISKEIDVFVAFETMNNRGKPLSTLELLKNRLIYLVVHFPEAQAGDSKQLRKQINDAWKTVYHNLGRNEQRPLNDDDFLTAHLALYYHTKISEDIPTEDDNKLQHFLVKSYEVIEQPSQFLLGTYFTRKRLISRSNDIQPSVGVAELQTYAAHLKNCADTYFRLSTPSSSAYPDAEKIALERLGRLLGHGADFIVLALYQNERSTNKRVAFIDAYERFVFCSSLRSAFRPRLPRAGTNIEFINYIKKKKKTEDIVNFFNNNVDQMFKEELVVESLHEWVKGGNGFYGWKSVRYFLFEYEMHLQANSRETRTKIDWRTFSRETYEVDYTSVEHIYPQRARAPFWTTRFEKFTPSERSALRNSLGNLLALSIPKNSSLGNKPFPEKVGVKDGAKGYRYGSFSEIEVSKRDDWNAIEILNRGVNMLGFLEARWHLTIGDRTQKAKALGLSFLLK